MFSRNRILLVFLLIIFYAVLFRPFERNIFNVQFVDEDDNFVTGTWILKGKKIYKDFFMQHQPIPTIISAVIQKIDPVNSIFLVVKRHREFVFIFSLLSFVLLTFRFGMVGFITAILYELSKFTLLGNLFLAESLVVPAVLYCIGSITSALTGHKHFSLFDLIIISFSLVYITFSLLPIFPFVIVSLIVLFTMLNGKLRLRFLSILGFIIFVIIILLSRFISFEPYLEDTISINMFEFAPYEIKDHFIIAFFKIILFPFIVLSYPHKDFYLLLQIISVIFVFSLIVLLIKRKFKISLITYFLFISLMLRPWSYDTLYSGFHFIPAFAAIIWLSLFVMDHAKTVLKTSYQKIIVPVMVLILVWSFVRYGLKELNTRTNQYDSWYSHYSPYFDYGETVRLLSLPQDTLMINPDASLIYWQSGLLPNSQFFFIYSFMYKSKKMNNLLINGFSKNFPVFIYTEQELEKDPLFSRFSGDYTRVYQNKKSSRLYIRNENIKKISEEAWKSVARYGFYKHID